MFAITEIRFKDTHYINKENGSERLTAFVITENPLLPSRLKEGIGLLKWVRYNREFVITE